jgi:histidinol-phosphate aminotransferase
LDPVAAFGGAMPVGRYPNARPLEAQLAAMLGGAADRVLVTAGADEALDRACRAVLAAGRSAVITDPTFEMIPRYVAMTGAACRTVEWPAGPLPVDALVASTDATTALVVIVSPNNPTGAAADFADIKRVHDAVPQSLIVLDLAYAEFAADDPTALALACPRMVVVRTLSKAWGLAGLRVGYAAGAPDVIGWMRRAGGPFAVASTSLALAEAALRDDGARRDAVVRSTLDARARVSALLGELGVRPLPSEANFVTVAGPRARWVADALAGQGIATRFFDTEPNRVRITMPVNAPVRERLERALRQALAPDAILFDLDGVLADVSGSFRVAIIETAKTFGVNVTPEDVRARKAQGRANDDWSVTAELIAARGVTASLADVTSAFQRIYEGASGMPGLRDTERLTVPRAWLEALAARYPLAIVTGRPRRDATWFLERVGIADLFRAVITRDDAPLKPDPAPVAAACRALGAERAWMIGDTPDDVVAARGAGVLPIGMVPPGDADGAATAASLERAGAGRVLATLTELDECLS